MYGGILVEYCHHPREVHEMPRDWSRTNPKIKVTADQLRTMYHDQQMSQSEIARVVGCDQTYVGTLMRRHGIAARSRNRSDHKKNAKIAAWRATQFSPMTNPFVKGSPHKTMNGKKQRLYRCVAEAVLGRVLAEGETVHHCDNNQRNNRPDNLWVFPSRSDHTRYHRTGLTHPDTIKLSELVMTGATTETHTEAA